MWHFLCVMFVCFERPDAEGWVPLQCGGVRRVVYERGGHPSVYARGLSKGGLWLLRDEKNTIRDVDNYGGGGLNRLNVIHRGENALRFTPWLGR